MQKNRSVTFFVTKKNYPYAVTFLKCYFCSCQLSKLNTVQLSKFK